MYVRTFFTRLRLKTNTGDYELRVILAVQSEDDSKNKDIHNLIKATQMKHTHKSKRPLKNSMNKLAISIGVISGSLLALSPSVQAVETTYSFGGFVKADAIFSQYSDQQRAGNVGDDFLVPSTTAVGDGSKKGDVVFDSHARTSRIFFKTVTDTDVGEIKTHIEMDFNAGNDERLTNQSGSGLRHAFISWKNSENSSILAGQTWTTFFNTSALPESADFVGTTSGTIFARQTQIRYTHDLGNGKVMFSAENPSVSLYNGGSGFADNNDVDDSGMPDLIGRYDGKTGALNYSAAAMVRQINYTDQINDKDDSQFGLGLTVSGKYAFSNGDDFKFMLSHGQLGRYIALNAFRDGTVEADGDIELITTMGGYMAYRHMWSDKLRSTVSYAYSEADNPDTITTDVTKVTKSVSNANINLMYSPTKNLTFGGEYIVADRKVENGDNGDLNRLHLTSKWVF